MSDGQEGGNFVAYKYRRGLCLHRNPSPWSTHSPNTTMRGVVSSADVQGTTTILPRRGVSFYGELVEFRFESRPDAVHETISRQPRNT